MTNILTEPRAVATKFLAYGTVGGWEVLGGWGVAWCTKVEGVGFGVVGVGASGRSAAQV